MIITTENINIAEASFILTSDSYILVRRIQDTFNYLSPIIIYGRNNLFSNVAGPLKHRP